MSKQRDTLKTSSGLRIAAAVADEDCSELKNALVVFRQAVAAVDSFHSIYLAFRMGSKGATSHGEQDLLRAMLVFACSGLDAVVKQLLRDALASVVDCDIGAEKEFQKFVERRFKKASTLDDKDRDGPTLQAIDTRLLASTLVHRNPRQLLIAMLRDSLTDDSLQSRDQLLRVASHFAITKEQVMADEIAKEGFKTRNEIIHEMDVNLSGGGGAGQRKRRQRAYEDMKAYSVAMLSIAARFINAVSAHLKPSAPLKSRMARKKQRR